METNEAVRVITAAVNDPILIAESPSGLFEFSSHIPNSSSKRLQSIPLLTVGDSLMNYSALTPSYLTLISTY